MNDSEFVSRASIEAWVDERLDSMWERPGMWGTPAMVEAEGYLLVEMWENFAHVGGPRPIQPSRALYIDFARQHPSTMKRPSPMPLHQWFTDLKWGSATSETTEHMAGQQIVEFFIAFKAHIKALP